MPGCNYCRLQIENLDPASPEMDDVRPQNLANLQKVAADYIASMSHELDTICAALAEGRGSDMPGIGRPTLTHA